MPAFGRMLLMLAALFVGWPVIVVMADELPEDTNTIESLTVEQARKLVETFPVEAAGPLCLPLNRLKQLDAATATALAEFKGDVLSLSGLTTLDVATASALAAFKGTGLDLSGLTTVDTETARALIEFRDGKILSLDGLQRASFGAVRALRSRPGVSMPNHWYYPEHPIVDTCLGTVRGCPCPLAGRSLRASLPSAHSEVPALSPSGLRWPPTPARWTRATPHGLNHQKRQLQRAPGSTCSATKSRPSSARSCSWSWPRSWSGTADASGLRAD